MSYNYDQQMLYDTTVSKLKEIGVELEDIAEIVLLLQSEYIDDLTLEECLENIKAVLRKREVIHAVLTGLAIDEMAQKQLLPEPIQSIIAKDEKLYGIDEVLPLGIVNLYGTIGLTNFGYLDKKKIGIIDELDKRKKKSDSLKNVETFADDIIAAIAAAAAARIAHSRQN
ncbi:phosphatidylglycerophosphatase A [Peptoniphilus asaccharolyticus DSM 20463]|uniref:Phosphatidylglycerophosphatase A n=1 Tax=Peptoniphilus asaccharolyticus DSM 20463 TaxID=573058 RepID=A0A1W1VHK2_PEPAS|nr:phosphatidylglycerophosphatase A [Peptoniphilus asaccharolyticus]MBL7574289.1 phosphatidylglycerophosphatase A [Peptoniphilus asaccharolyticus]SMB92733.1 phosphatidylglycerophosphatase A [Peptoniphilus asaccharolyticus DSM 20463]